MLKFLGYYVGKNAKLRQVYDLLEFLIGHIF